MVEPAQGQWERPFIRLVPEVFSVEECAAMVERIEALKPEAAPITTAEGFEMRPDIRNNDRAGVKYVLRTDIMYRREG